MSAPTDPGAGRPGLERNGGLVGLLGVTIQTDVMAGLRSVEFAIGVIAVPVLLYTMFGLPSAADELPGGTRIGAMMLVSLTSYGIVSLAIFAFGDLVAKERGRGWHRTLQATPLPIWVSLGGKMAMAVAYALLITTATSLVAATAGGVTLSAGTWLAFVGTMLLGVVAFSTFGFAIAYLARPRTAGVVANLLFLPLSFFSGFFVPLSQLPGVMRDLAPWLPTYHFGQLAWQGVAPAVDVRAFTGISSPGTLEHVLWLLGSAVVFGTIAVLGARREAATRRG